MDKVQTEDLQQHKYCQSWKELVKKNTLKSSESLFCPLNGIFNFADVKQKLS
jgi:hypothetical protein